MKIAVLSDIHSNIFALEAVLADAYNRGAEKLLNLGDILYGPIAPMATYHLLQKHDCVTIQGNQDRQIYQTASSAGTDNATMRFVLEDLGAEPVAWLQSLPFDCRLSEAIYLCHGSPRDDQEYLLEDVSFGVPNVRMENEILAGLDGQTAEVILCGHSHIPRVVQIATGQLLINPGSVGLPAYTDDAPVRHSMENFSPQATYAIIENNTFGWTTQVLKVPYDYQKAVQKAEEQQRMDWGWYLATGRGDTDG